MILCHHRESKVDTGGDPCGRPHATVAGKDLVPFKPDCGVAHNEIRGAAPMRRGPAAVQQACRSKDVGAGTHACDPNPAPG